MSPAYQPAQFLATERAASRWRLDNPRFLLHVSLILVSLAFIPFIAQANAFSGGFSLSRFYETLFIVLGFAVMPVYLLAQGQSLTTRLHPQLPMVAYCGWCLLSVLWSLDPQLTLSRGIELTAIVFGSLLYCDAFRRFQTSEYQFANTLVIVMLVMVLCGLAANTIIWGSPFAMKLGETLEGTISRPRLRIGYGHPGVMADLASFGIIAMFASRLSWKVQVPILALFLYVKQLTDTRSASVALLFALLSMFLLKRDRRIALFSTYIVSWMIFGYFFLANSGSRPDDLLGPIRPLFPEDLASMNGRTEVWTVAWNFIRESPILGLGYYSSRFVLMPVVAWAGDTHNNWIEILLMTGAIGLVIFVLFLVSAYSTAIRTKDALALGVLVYTTCYTITSIPLFVPEIPMVVVLLAISQARLRQVNAPPKPLAFRSLSNSMSHANSGE